MANKPQHPYCIENNAEIISDTMFIALLMVVSKVNFELLKN